MLRFAPSPTGDMHIGNLRVALLNHIVSMQTGKELLIRIEDTDDSRNVDNKDKEILDILDKFKIDYKSVIYQSKNLSLHRKLAAKLLVEKKAFCCFCDEATLKAKKEKAKLEKKTYRYDGTCANLSDKEVLAKENESFTIRVKKPEKNIVVEDLLRGVKEFEPYDVDSFIILKKDKKPTYNYACAIDDISADIDLIIRGEDHYSNSAKQKHLQLQLGYTKDIKYMHLPMILNKETNKKMSKRDDASSVKWLLNQGYLVEAITNYLLLLGYKAPKEIFNLKEATEWFDIKRISRAPAKFDITKLSFINREHIRLKDDMELAKLAGYDSAYIGRLIKLYCEEGSTINEIKVKVDKFFLPKEDKGEFKAEIDALKSIIKDLDIIDSFDEFKAILNDKSGLSGKPFFKSLRYILTGAHSGPNLSDIYPIIKDNIKNMVK